MPASMANMSVLTVLRATVVALLALIGMFFPSIVPEDMVEAMAERVVQVVAGVFWLWMAAIAWRLKRQNQGKEVT